MIGFALLLQIGAAGPPAPTVGDTVWLGRTVAIPRGATVRPADWEPTDPVESLGPPRVTLRGDSADIAYPVAIWRAGTELVSLPGPLLLGANGTVDSVEPVEVPVTVASVLPPTPSDSVLAPQPRAAVVPRGVRSVVPVLVTSGIAALLLLPLHLLWRRRGRARPTVRATFESPPVIAPLAQWAAAGETRAVAAHAAAGLRRALDARGRAADRPVTDDAGLEELLRELESARFGGPSPDAVALARRAAELEQRVGRPEPSERM